MKSKLWVFRNINLFQRASLAQALSISPATASLFLSRGVTTPDQATAWMSLQVPHDPFLIPDMEQAVDRLHRAVTTHEQICFYGDYDVDGITATSVYLSFFGGLGAQVRAYVPHRRSTFFPRRSTSGRFFPSNLPSPGATWARPRRNWPG